MGVEPVLLTRLGKYMAFSLSSIIQSFKDKAEELRKKTLRGGLEIGAAIQRRIPESIQSPARTITNIIREPLTPRRPGLLERVKRAGGTALTGPRIGLELSNIVTSAVQEAVTGGLRKTPLKEKRAGISLLGRRFETGVPE